MEKRECCISFDYIDNARKTLDGLLSDPFSFNDFSGEIAGISKKIQDAVSYDEDAALATILLSKGARYAIKHCVDIAIICEIIGRGRDWSQKERLSLMAAVLTQNISMVELQEKLHIQAAPLTPGQHEAIMNHPKQAVEMLQKLGVKNKLWLKCVLQHHEAPDGSGYPAGLKAKDISPGALLIAVADFYSAKIIGRGYRESMTVLQAMQFVFLGKDSRVDKKVAGLFIKTLGIYLPGTCVDLRNGDIAVVARRTEKANNPVVFSFASNTGKVRTTPLKRFTSEPGFTIEDVTSPNRVNFRIDPYAIWGKAQYL